MKSAAATEVGDIELWLVDGFNVLHACLLAGRDRQRWWGVDRQREVVEWVTAFARRQRVSVVFDAASDASPRLELGDAAPAVDYAPSADDAIVERVRAASNAWGMCVVSADRSLGDRCRHWGARVERPWDFARRIAAS